MLNRKYLALILTLIIILTSCNLPNEPWVLVEITNYEDGQSVLLNEEVRIIAEARSSQGIDRVEFFINDELAFVNETPFGAPRDHIADQPWIPTVEGQVMVSVIAYDRMDNPSEPHMLTLQVVVSADELETEPTQTPTVPPEELALTQTAQAGCTNSASFIEHVTIPINTFVSANANFTKIWRVNNNGTCDWVGYQLVHTNGNLMGASSPRALPMIEAGANADLLIDMVAPSTPGTHSAGWRIQAGDGTLFGPELTVSINVPESPTDTPVPTPTFTSTPTMTPPPTATATSLPISVQQYSEQFTLPPNTSESNMVTCPSGSVPVSGGFSHEPEIRVWRSVLNSNGWRVSATNTHTAARSITITATCLFNTGGSSASVPVDQNAQPNDFTQFTVACPSGSIVTGGGWDLYANNNLKVYHSSKSGNAWRLTINNPSGDLLPVSAYAICLSGVPGSTAQRENIENNVPANGSANAEQLCPSSSFVTGGGFSMDRELNLYNTTKQGNGWINHVTNPTGVDKRLDTFAICYTP